MGWFTKRRTDRVSPDQNDTNPASPARIIPPDETPAWIAESQNNEPTANMFAREGDAWSYSVPRIPDPAQGGYVEEANTLGWSDGLGKAFPQGQPFTGTLLDPSMNPTEANYGGMVGTTYRADKMGTKLEMNYFPDSSSDSQVGNDYMAWQNGMGQ